MMRDDIIDFLDKNNGDVKATAAEFGISEADLINDYPINEMIEWYRVQNGGEPTEGVDSSMIDMDSNSFTPDYSMTAEYEGDGITSELIPGEGLTLPFLESLGVDPTTAAVIASVATKNPKALVNKVEGMFTPRKNKGNLLTDARGTKSGEVVKGGKTGDTINAKTQAKSKQHMQKNYGDANKNTKQITKVDGKGGPLAKTNQDKVKFGLTNANKFKAGAGIATGVALDQAYRGLTGNRNANGDFTVFDEDMLDPPTGPDMVPETVPETMGNQYGYHKQEGQNFWTVNNDDAYWDTHEMGTGDAWSDAELKKAPAKELDWSSWFN